MTFLFAIAELIRIIISDDYKCYAASMTIVGAQEVVTGGRQHLFTQFCGWLLNSQFSTSTKIRKWHFSRHKQRQADASYLS